MDVVVEEGVLRDLFHSQLGDTQWEALCSTLKLSRFSNTPFEQDELQRFVFILLRHAPTLLQPLAKFCSDSRYPQLCQQWNTLVEEDLYTKQLEQVQQLTLNCWQFLPVELLACIFTYVDRHSKDAVRLVNKRWNETMCRMITSVRFDEQEELDAFQWDLFCNVNTICFDSESIELLSLANVPSGRIQGLNLSYCAGLVDNYGHLSPQRLQLEGLQTGEEVQKLLHAFTQVEALDMQDLQVEEGMEKEVGKTLCQMHSLTQLSLSDAAIWGPSVGEVTNMTSLTSLTIVGEEPVDSDGINMVSALSSLTELVIHYGGDPNLLAQIKQLKSLDLQIGEDAVIEMGILMHMTNLTNLSVCDFSLGSHCVPESISRLSNLTFLRLDSKICEIPTTLQSLNNLTELVLSYNHLDTLKGEWFPESLHTLDASLNAIKKIEASFWAALDKSEETGTDFK